MRIRSILTLVVPALLVAGCNSDPAAPETVRADNGTGGTNGGGGSSNTAGTGNTAGTAGTSNNAGSGQGGSGGDPGGKVEEAPYPAGPYGLEVGDVVRNFKFDGLRNPKAVDYSTATTEVVAFSDFYNPTNDPTKTRVLVVTASARWCTYCKSEASKSMGYHKYWNPKGVVFLTTLFDNETPGEPATYTDLNLWTKAYKLEYPVVLDPNPPQLGVFFKLDAAPFNMVLDTTTMKILFKTEGEVDFGSENPTLKAAVGE